MLAWRAEADDAEAADSEAAAALEELAAAASASVSTSKILKVYEKSVNSAQAASKDRRQRPGCPNRAGERREAVLRPRDAL